MHKYAVNIQIYIYLRSSKTGQWAKGQCTFGKNIEWAVQERENEIFDLNTLLLYDEKHTSARFDSLSECQNVHIQQQRSAPGGQMTDGETF